MRKAFLSLAAALVATLAIGCPLSAQTVRSGIEAWQMGDHGAAVAVWRPLAAKGDADAAFNLGQAYRLGKGVPIDLAQAQILFEQAARKDHVDAATTLGILLFQNGNRAAAMRWLGKSAGAGDARAMLLYGTALYNGDGVAPDPVMAYAYVSRAAAQGLAPAVATLADLDLAMTLEQRQQGVERAKSMAAAKPFAEATPPTASARMAKPRPASASPTPEKPIAKATSLATAGKWRIQLGAFGQRGAAEKLFARLAGKMPGRTAYYLPAGQIIRLQVGPFDSRASAVAACARLLDQACFAVEAR